MQNVTRQFLWHYPHLEEVPGVRLNLRQYLHDVPGPVVGEVGPEDVSVLRPVLLSRGAEHSHDPGQLVTLVQTREERLPADQLGEDAAAGPDVYRGGVGGAQQDLGCSVPQGHHLQYSPSLTGHTLSVCTYS